VAGAENTIIDANFISNILVAHSKEDFDTVIEGLEIRKGYGTYGGGMYCYNANPTIMNCRFVENISNLYGGGICLHALCSPQIINCVFDRNVSDFIGGGIACFESSNHIRPTEH
jgi:hypothetical protein